MLRKLKIRRFRSIRDAEVEFGRVNLFIGPNGSGKSNLLEALGTVSAAVGRGLDGTSLSERGVRLSLPHMFKSSFKNLDLPRTFELDADLQAEDGDYKYKMAASASEKSDSLYFATEKLVVGRDMVFGRSPAGVRLHRTVQGDSRTVKDWHRTRSLWDSHGSTLAVPDSVRGGLAELAAYAIYAPQTAVMRGTAVEQNPRTPLGLAGSGMARAIMSLAPKVYARAAKEGDSVRVDVDSLTKIIDLSRWSDQIQVGPFDPNIVPTSGAALGSTVVYLRDRYMRGGRNYLSPFDASEGTLYLLFVAMLLIHPDTPAILALDNVDSTLNPSLVRDLLEIISGTVCSPDSGRFANAKQVFLTSHNPTALDGIDLFDPQQRVFVVHRDESDRGSTKFFRLIPPEGTTKEDWIVAKQGAKLSNLWIDGLLPFALGDD